MGAGSSPAVLVTGGTGFIGSHLVNHLTSSGYRVRCLVRQSSSRSSLPPGIELVQGDLVTGAGLEEAACGIELVFHVAGVTKAISSMDYYRGNAEATGNLLRACEQASPPPARFVHVSSLAAVGPSSDGIPVREDCPPHPVSQYGKSKLASEEAVRRSSLSGRAVIVRPPVVFGPGDKDVFRIFQAIRKGIFLRIGRQEQFFSLIYVKDLVEGLLAAATGSNAPGRKYFIAAPEPVSWSEFGALAAALMKCRVRTVHVPGSAAWGIGLAAEIAAGLSRKPGILSREKIAEAAYRFWTCDVARAYAELNFRARTCLRDAVSETLAWYKETGWLSF